MTAATQTLADFILACIAEDEAKAREFDWAEPKHYEVTGLEASDEYITLLVSPARVLAECDAKRRIVEALTYVADHRREQVAPGRFDVIPVREPYHDDVADEVLRYLAAPYADREGFREEWRP